MSDEGKPSPPVVDEQKDTRIGAPPERAQQFTTISGHPIRRLYTPGDLSDWSPQRDLGVPGEPPYTRGIHATMYRRRLWTMRQFAGFGTAERSEERRVGKECRL